MPLSGDEADAFQARGREAQCLRARRPSVQIPVGEYVAGEGCAVGRLQHMVGGQVGVSVDQGRCLRRLQPLHSGGVVHIAIEGSARLLAGLALGTRAAALGAARGQWQCEQLRLPLRVARHGAEFLVGHVRQAQRIAMAQEPAATGEDQHRGILQHGDARRLGEPRSHQEVAVAVHEVEGLAGCGAAQQRTACSLEAAGLLDRVVAHPDLEQVAQQEHGVGGRRVQVMREGIHRGRVVRLQVQVGNEIHRAPCAGRNELPDVGRRQAHGSTGFRSASRQAAASSTRAAFANRKAAEQATPADAVEPALPGHWRRPPCGGRREATQGGLR